MFLKRLLHMRSMLSFSLLIFISISALAQDKVVTGKVMDSKDGTPVVGATVTVKGTNIGTATSVDGTFKLTVPASAKKVVITSVGFIEREVDITSSNINI